MKLYHFGLKLRQGKGMTKAHLRFKQCQSLCLLCLYGRIFIPWPELRESRLFLTLPSAADVFYGNYGQERK